MSLIPVVDHIQSTSDGRYRVTIETFRTGDDAAANVEDQVVSLNELAGILSDEAQLALRLSCRLLDDAAGVRTGEE